MSHRPQVSHTVRPAIIFRLISQVTALDKRNLVRGYASKDLRTSSEIEAIREGNSLQDIMTIGALLKGADGLLDGNKKKASTDLFKFTRFCPLGWKDEIRYTAGYLNSCESECLSAVQLMQSLGQIERLETNVALEAIHAFARTYGASNFLSYKLAYLRVARQLTAPQLAKISSIEEEFAHRDKPGFHFSAMENLSPRVSLFLIAQRRVSSLVGKVDGELRKSYVLSNFIPTPLDDEDLAAFLLRASESSLVDTLHALIVILNLQGKFPEPIYEVKKRLTPPILAALEELTRYNESVDDGLILTDHYQSGDGESESSLDLYRLSSAFLERKHLAKFRHELDSVIGTRLLAEIITEKCNYSGEALPDKNTLLQPDGSIVRTHPKIPLDSFYRTFLFLQFIKDRTNFMDLTDSDIKYIFENTMSLESLFTEAEIRSLYGVAPDESQKLIAVLALALFRKTSIDPDVDFAFREDLVSHVKLHHNGSIVDFIDSLISDSPQIASYIAESLDEVTLEKMYEIIETASQAAEIRRDLLRLLGRKLSRIEYLIEADAIETRSKLSTLQKYFDSSRMYVDSVAMKKWLDGNPSVSTEQLRTLQPSIHATLRTIESELGESTDIYFIALNAQSEELIEQIAKDSFEQFCLNTEFGIESYLGRRIRHNTLDGVTTETVDAVFNKPEYNMVPSMKRTVDAWMSQYRAIVDKLRKEHLQFKSGGSLFNSNIDFDDSTTKENIRLLSSSLRIAGSQLLNDLVISFCWKQISPQLENAARYIKTDLLQEATSSIDKHFSGSFGSAEEQIKIGLHEAVSSVFMKVSDWFRVPQTGFISASVKELCEIILYDLNRSRPVEYEGEALENKYTGISVHRLYDCLAVLLQNALTHGEEGKPVVVNVTARKSEGNEIFDVVLVEVTSTVAPALYENSKQRIERAISAIEHGTDMVTEGYTGIKKVKFITQKSEGQHTVAYTANIEAKSLMLSFSLHSEIMLEDPVGVRDEQIIAC